MTPRERQILDEAVRRALPITLDVLRSMGRESAEYWLSTSGCPKGWADMIRAEYRRLLDERGQTNAD